MMLDQPRVARTQDDRVLGDMPAKGQKILSDLGDIPAQSHRIFEDLGDSSAKGQAMPAGEMVERPEDDQSENEPTNLMPSTPERDAELQEWCLLPEVALRSANLDASDGSIKPLTVDEMEELIKSHPVWALDQESFVQGLFGR